METVHFTCMDVNITCMTKRRIIKVNLISYITVQEILINGIIEIF